MDSAGASSASTDAALLEQARRLREDARELLEGTGLLAALRAVGPVTVLGSVALDLMTWPDIDLEVQLPQEWPDAAQVGRFFDLGRALATRFAGLVLHFQNRFLWPEDQVPASPGRALYWNVTLRHAGQTWKLDLFGLGPAVYQEEARQFAALRARLAAADRTAILRVKDAVCRRAEYRGGSGRRFSSLDIYEAVAGHGVRTVDAFDDWLRRRVDRSAPGQAER